MFANGNNAFRMGHAGPQNRFRVAIGPGRYHWLKMGRARQQFSRLNVHTDRGYGAAHWHTKAKTYRWRNVGDMMSEGWMESAWRHD